MTHLKNIKLDLAFKLQKAANFILNSMPSFSSFCYSLKLDKVIRYLDFLSIDLLELKLLTEANPFNFHYIPMFFEKCVRPGLFLFIFFLFATQ